LVEQYQHPKPAFAMLYESAQTFHPFAIAANQKQGRDGSCIGLFVCETPDAAPTATLLTQYYQVSIHITMLQ